MLCLGIESSCDDTSLALVRDGILIDEAASSQVDVHALFGGVVPELASREHARLIGPLCDKLLADNSLTAKDIDLIAVTRGPGLLGSLLVGVAFAKALALGCGARFIGVNHLHAHLLAAGLEEEMTFPALGLLVSGGHTHLYRIDDPVRFTVLGKTLDDAAGEAFDKAGKMLGLPYPAGRQIDILAAEGNADPKLFPRPYIHSGNLDFSFSGLKTAMQTYLSSHPDLRVLWDASTGEPALPPAGPLRATLADCCASYRLAVVDTLRIKAKAALEEPANRDVQSLVLAGGVAANSLLRQAMEALAKDKGIKFTVPRPALCADNGAMAAYSGWLLACKGYGHSLRMEAIPRGRAMPEDMVVQAV